VNYFSFEIEPTKCRQLSVRFRVVFGKRGARLEPVLAERPLGMPVGDALLFKPEVDVFIEGKVHPRTEGARESTLRLHGAGLDVSARVFGSRAVVKGASGLRIGEPARIEPFDLDARESYGGDAYPRNPLGQGFITDESGAVGTALPRVEDPSDLLTNDRLVASPARWWEQPRPALFEPRLASAFPRGVVLGLLKMPAPAPPDADRDFAQEAPRQLRLARLEPGMSLTVEGCLPSSRAWTWAMPAEPAMRLSVEGRAVDAPAVAQTVRLRPDADEAVVTFAFEHTMHRAFVPGLHARIPIEVEVLGERRAFPTPEPTLVAVRRGLAQMKRGAAT